MASPPRCAAAAATAAQDREAGAVDGVLPAELLLEVLLRLPAKTICRLRAVCRSWRSFTSDPLFVAAYAARYPHPLLAVGVGSLPGGCIYLVDLSGRVVEIIRGVGKGRVVSASSRLVIVDGENHRVSVVNPSTGSVSVLPSGIGDCDARRSRRDGSMCPAWFAFGQTASTGEYKLLRIVFDDESRGEDYPVCEVFSIGDMNGQWRKVERPPGYLHPSCPNGVVFKGAAYLWQDERFIGEKCIPSFDLATEQWSMTLQWPEDRILEEANGTLDYPDLIDRLMLAEIKGTLSIAHWNDKISAVDLWFLIDFEKSMWSKEHRIKFEFTFYHIGNYVQPLLVTDEGKVVLWIASKGLVRIYNPVTNTYLDIVKTSIFAGAGVYTGNLICPGSA